MNNKKRKTATFQICLTAILTALNIAFCTVSVPVPGSFSPVRSPFRQLDKSGEI